MKKPLPKLKKSISSRPEQTAKEYVEDRIAQKRIEKEELDKLGGYLCESHIYSQENYDRIKFKYASYAEANSSTWLEPIYQANKDEFLKQFAIVKAHTGDWIEARMLVQCSIPTMVFMGKDIFSWADELMIESFANSISNR